MPKTIHKDKARSIGWSIKVEGNYQLRCSPLVPQSQGVVVAKGVVAVWEPDPSLTYEKKDGNMVRRLVDIGGHRKESHSVTVKFKNRKFLVNEESIEIVEINPKYELIHRMMLLSRVINGKFDLQKSDVCEDDRPFVEEIRGMDTEQQRVKLAQMKIARRAFD